MPVRSPRWRVLWSSTVSSLIFCLWSVSDSGVLKRPTRIGGRSTFLGNGIGFCLRESDRVLLLDVCMRERRVFLENSGMPFFPHDLPALKSLRLAAFFAFCYHGVFFSICLLLIYLCLYI